jgi:hypothetical protein
LENLIRHYDKCLNLGNMWRNRELMSKHILMLFLSPLISIRVKERELTLIFVWVLSFWVVCCSEYE